MRRAARETTTVGKLLGTLYVCALLQASGCLEGDVVVLEPQGGEDFSVGSTMAIRWASIGVERVRIELSRDGGASWTTIASSTDAGGGAHSWAVTDGESQSCLVRITDTSEDAVSDTSDGLFTIGRRGFVVEIPNGGETWYHMGPDRLVEWSSFDVADEVDLCYSVDGGTSWMVMATGVADTGSYVWTVPNFDSTRCRVRVEETGGGGLDDASDADFTIEPLPGADFVDADAGLTGVDSCALRWGDFDSDGFFDLIVAGDETGSGDAATRLYLNQDGAGMSLAAGTGLPDVERCALDWGDFDSDGDLDLALAGTTDGDLTGAVARVYRNESGSLVQAADLTGVVDCAVRWADLDADGDLDLIVAGAGAGGPLATVYLNVYGSFVQGSTLPGVARCALACADFDGDDLVDIALAGEDAAGDELAGVYRNLGGGFFEEAQALVGVKDCSLAWGDFDSDGDPDLALAGYTSTVGPIPITRLYGNDGGTFVDTGLGFVNVDECSLAWGDCDADGRLDLVVAGASGLGSVVKVYRNAGDGSGFVDTGALIAGGARSSVAWADWDRDGDLDLAISGSDDSQGRGCRVYENVSSLPNARPAPPTGLTVEEPASGGVVISWLASTDAESPPPALTYNLVLLDAYGTEVVPGMSDPVSGVRRVPAPGNAGQNRSMTVFGLGRGTYTYSVQAVDPGLAASDWAEWQTFYHEGLDGMAMGAGCVSIGDGTARSGQRQRPHVPAPLPACSVTALLLVAAFFQMVKRALRRRRTTA